MGQVTTAVLPRHSARNLSRMMRGRASVHVRTWSCTRPRLSGPEDGAARTPTPAAAHMAAIFLVSARPPTWQMSGWATLERCGAQGPSRSTPTDQPLACSNAKPCGCGSASTRPSMSQEAGALDIHTMADGISARDELPGGRATGAGRGWKTTMMFQSGQLLAVS
jgi:hypothetical protein